MRFWLKWRDENRFILFVYSHSPHWQRYIETNILPRISPHAVILNWSERSSWQENKSVEVKIFENIAGTTEFNPMAIILSPVWPIKTLRFWQAFKEFKHGKHS